MHILCRFTSLLKLVLVVLAIGLAIGYWAGHRDAEAAASTSSATQGISLPEQPGMASLERR
jgi:hypothetical protein